MQIGDSAVAKNQWTEPDHWVGAQQHHFQLVDDRVGSSGQDAILASCAYGAILVYVSPVSFTLYRFQHKPEINHVTFSEG